MGSRKSGKTHAQAREQTRQALFRAGAAMLTETATHDPFAAMTVRELCERASYSTGAFYAHWPNAGAFYEELTDYFMGQALGEDLEELRKLAELAGRRAGAAAILELAEADLALLLANESWDAVELLNVTHGRTELHREAAVEGYRTIDSLTGSTYAVLLERLGREPRPPLTSEHIGACLQALIEGFGLREKVDPDGARLPDAEHPGLYAHAVACLLVSMTRPAGDHRDLRESLEDSLG